MEPAALTSYDNLPKIAREAVAATVTNLNSSSVLARAATRKQNASLRVP